MSDLFRLKKEISETTDDIDGDKEPPELPGTAREI